MYQLSNTGRGDWVVYDLSLRPVRIPCGETRRIDLPAHEGERLERETLAGSPLKAVRISDDDDDRREPQPSRQRVVLPSIHNRLLGSTRLGEPTWPMPSILNSNSRS